MEEHEHGGPTPAGATVSNCTIAGNRAIGGSGADGGNGGDGLGGGLYLTPGGVACADHRTVIRANHASTGNDEVFGDLGFC